MNINVIWEGQLTLEGADDNEEEFWPSMSEASGEMLIMMMMMVMMMMIWPSMREASGEMLIATLLESFLSYLWGAGSSFWICMYCRQRLYQTQEGIVLL